MTSFDCLSSINDFDRKDIENHSGGLWKCIGKRESTYGGHVYEFIPYEEFDDWTPHSDLGSRFKNCRKKTMEMYPAVEMPSLEISFLCDNKSVIDLTFSGEFKRQFVARYNVMELTEEEKIILENKFLDEIEQRKTQTQETIADIWTSHQKMRDYLSEIGYCVLLGSDNQLHLELPDLEALQNGWKHFQETHSDTTYPDLDVVSSEGIASDLEFFSAYKEHDALLSNGKEFVHDHLVHVKTRITRMLGGKENYEKEKSRIIGVIDHCATTIHTAIEREKEQNGENGTLHREREKLNFIVGMFTDVYFSYDQDSMIEKISLNSMENELSSWFIRVLSSGHWKNYLHHRFGPETNFGSIQELWKEVRKYVPYVES